MLRKCIWIVLANIVVISTPVHAAPPALIEVQVGSETLQGKVFAHNDRTFWLQSQDGRMRSLPADDVHKFRKISPQFAGWSGSIVRDNLRREFGNGFEVAGTRHYAVCAPSDRNRTDQKARVYAETFEELYRTFQMYFSVRGFTISEPEFPLVAVVFPDFESFARYARAEKVDGRGRCEALHAFVEPDCPRIARQCARSQLPRQGFLTGPSGPFGDAGFGRPRRFTCARTRPGGAFQGSLKDTMIHEATPGRSARKARIGENPKWVVED